MEYKEEKTLITPKRKIAIASFKNNVAIAEKRKEELNQKKIAQNNAKNVIFSGKVVDKNNKPVPFVIIKRIT